jgi:replicative DNA helicase
VIGSILLDPRCLDAVADVLCAADFYLPTNGRLFSHMLALDNERKPVDSTMLLERLEMERLTLRESEVVNWSVELYECIHSVPHVANAMYYAGIVREKSLLRGLIHASTETLRDSYAGVEPSQTILDRAEQRLQEVGAARTIELQNTTELAIEVGDYVDAIIQRGQHLGLPTGLASFDEQVGGLFGGELIVLAARPGVGKSALASQIANYNGERGRMVYLASLEMSGRELAMRDICRNVEVNSRAIRTGKLNDGERANLISGMAQYGQSQIVIDARSELTVESLGRTIRRLVSKGLSLAVVDYLGLLTPSDRMVKRYEQVGHQTRALKLLAREVGVPLLVLCQLSRAAMEDSTPPQLHHLRESGSIESDADVVLFIHRPEGGIMIPDPIDKKKKIKADWPAELIVAKQRNGTVCRLKLDWTPEYTRFDCWGAREFTEFSAFA